MAFEQIISREDALVAKIDAAIALANQLSSIRSVVSESEIKSLNRWIVRWRGIRAKVLQEKISA